MGEKNIKQKAQTRKMTATYEQTYRENIYKQFGLDIDRHDSTCALDTCQQRINIYESVVVTGCELLFFFKTNSEPIIMHQACFGQYEGRLVDELAKQGKL